jgi:hypothetical protein
MAPTTAQEIYDLLAADDALAELLGTVTLKGAEEPLPALSVLWPLEEEAAETVIDGVEVVIARIPSGANEPFMTGGEQLSAQFQLYITQWSVPADGTFNLDATVQRIAQLLPGATWSDNTVPGGLGGLGQVAMLWRNPEVMTRWEDDPEPEPEAED